jgi:hypothetical protein
MFNNAGLQSASLITASLLSIAALASALPASAQQYAQQADPAQKRAQAYVTCRREADAAVPLGNADSEQVTMNHYLAFSRCLLRFGYALGDNAGNL